MKRTKTGGSLFGLALVAMLLFGAIAASGAQALAWHVDGKTLAERGEEKASYNMWSEGTLTLDIPNWNVTVNCDVAGASSGYLIGADEGTGTLKATNCQVAESLCEVDPITFPVELGLIEGGETGAIETFTPSSWFYDLSFHGELCALDGISGTLWYHEGAVGAEVDSSKTQLSLTGSSAQQARLSFGSNQVYMSLGGSMEQWYYDPTVPLDVW